MYKFSTCEALQWVDSFGMENVIFESDAEAVVDAIHSQKDN